MPEAIPSNEKQCTKSQELLEHGGKLVAELETIEGHLRNAVQRLAGSWAEPDTPPKPENQAGEQQDIMYEWAAQLVHLSGAASRIERIVQRLKELV